MAKDDFLGAHSDPVETIGPWAIIASVTFGAARHFRMKPVAPISYTGEGGELEEDRYWTHKKWWFGLGYRNLRENKQIDSKICIGKGVVIVSWVY